MIDERIREIANDAVLAIDATTQGTLDCLVWAKRVRDVLIPALHQALSERDAEIAAFALEIADLGGDVQLPKLLAFLGMKEDADA